jgi:TonB family protein
MLKITLGVSLALHFVVLSLCAIKKRALIGKPFVVLNLQTQRGPQTHFKAVEQPKQETWAPPAPTRTSRSAKTPAAAKAMPGKTVDSSKELKKPVKKEPAKKKSAPVKPIVEKKPVAAPQKLSEKTTTTDSVPTQSMPQGKVIDVQTPIQQEVERLWRPPIGSAKGIECVVRFTVSPRGLVEQAEIISSSKIIAYDMSVMRVAFQFKFASALWGKRFTIEFRQ